MSSTSQPLRFQQPRQPIPHPTHFVDYWSFDTPYTTIVVVPSLSFDCDLLRAIKGVSHYEERLLYNLILLKDPAYRIIYLTSLPVDEDIVKYYWDLIQAELKEKISFDSVKQRLTMLNCSDARNTVTLIDKILARPKLVQRIRSLLPDKEHSCLSVYVATEKEKQLAELLDIDFLAGDVKRHHYFGTKSGSKELFAKCGVPTSDFTKIVFSEDELAAEIERLMKKHPKTNKIVVKLNEGFSGEGNAMLHVDDVWEYYEEQLDEDGTLLDAVRLHLPEMHFISKKMSWQSFLEKVQSLGAIAELFVENNGSNPSCQAVIDQDCKVIIMSTHDQILEEMEYKGCGFPADSAYRSKLIEYTRRIGEGLAKEGVRSHFGVDFLVGDGDNEDESLKSSDSSPPVFALELNIRQCGTTHTYVTTKLLTNSVYDPESGDCISLDDNSCKTYLASDNLCFRELEGLLPQDIRDYEHYENNLHFSRATGTGVVFHLLGAASQYAKLGMVAIANSGDDAKELYNRAIYHFLQYATLEKRAVKMPENECASAEDLETV